MSPLFKKLNLGLHTNIHVINAPASFEDELRALDGVDIKRTVSGATRFALAFAITQAEVDTVAKRLVKAADGDAILWMIYPKGTSRKYKCDFNRDTGWKVLEKAGFAPVRMVAIDADWSALRFRKVEFIPQMTRSAKR